MFKKLSFQKRLFTLLAILSLSSVAFIFANLKPSPKDKMPLPTPTPPTQIVSDNPQIQSLKPEKYRFSTDLQSFPFPSSLPVYTAAPPTPIFLSPLFNQFISLYRLEPSSTSKDYYYSKDRSIILLFDSKNQYLTYKINGTVTPSAYLGTKKPTLDSAISAAKEFLKPFTEYNELEPQKDLVSFAIVKKIGAEFETTIDQSKANMINIPFTQYISGFPYRYFAATSPPVVITVAQNNQIVSAYFSPQPMPQLASPRDFPLLDSSQILEDLNLGRGTVLYAPLYYLKGNTTLLPETTITKIQLEYRMDIQINKVLPYYLITGNCLPDKSAKTPVEIQILLPAIHQD